MDTKAPRTKPGREGNRRRPLVDRSKSSAPCIICGRPVSTMAGQHHYCLFPREGIAHKACAAKR